MDIKRHFLGIKCWYIHLYCVSSKHNNKISSRFCILISFVFFKLLLNHCFWSWHQLEWRCNILPRKNNFLLHFKCEKNVIFYILRASLNGLVHHSEHRTINWTRTNKIWLNPIFFTLWHFYDWNFVFFDKILLLRKRFQSQVSFIPGKFLSKNVSS